MGQHHQQIYNNTCREHREEIRSDEAPANQHSRGDIVGNYICEDIISPISLLRSDRFARSKPTAVVTGHGRVTARVSEPERDREDRTNSSAHGGLCREMISPMTEAISRRGGATVSAEAGGVKEVRKRGKAPSKVRPTTAPGPTSKARSTLGHMKSSEQDGENCALTCQVKIPPQEMGGVGSFSDIPTLETDFDARPSNKGNGRGQICLSPSVGPDIAELSNHGAQLSQSPLRSAPTAFNSLSEGYSGLSPMRSKPAIVRVSAEQMSRQVSQLGPSSQMDEEWSSRCFKLTQQIVEQLQSWGQSSSSDSQFSTSPILTRPQYSSTSSTSLTG